MSFDRTSAFEAAVRVVSREWRVAAAAADRTDAACWWDLHINRKIGNGRIRPGSWSVLVLQYAQCTFDLCVWFLLILTVTELLSTVDLFTIAMK